MHSEHDVSHYLKRNRLLKKLGFGSYREYLMSDLWREIREKVFAAKGRVCFLCPAAATEIHHCRYAKSDLLGRRMIGMFPLCGKCHHAVEFDPSGRKLSMPQMRHKFNTLKAGNKAADFPNRRFPGLFYAKGEPHPYRGVEKAKAKHFKKLKEKQAAKNKI